MLINHTQGLRANNHSQALTPYTPNKKNIHNMIVVDVLYYR
jgi:hypothetical protein